MIRTGIFSSPLGEIHLAKTDESLFRATFMSTDHLTFLEDIETRYGDSPRRDDKTFEQEFSFLNEYFSGGKPVVDFPIQFREGTPFQRSVWRELTRIPYGETISYGELARRVRNPNAFRAVGNANGKNPIGVIVPCHRVVCAGNRLGGFSSGLMRKVSLLRIEGHTISEESGISFFTKISC